MHINLRNTVEIQFILYLIKTNHIFRNSLYELLGRNCKNYKRLVTKRGKVIIKYSFPYQLKGKFKQYCVRFFSQHFVERDRSNNGLVTNVSFKFLITLNTSILF